MIGSETIGTYIDRLASREPTPGGGAAGAVHAAQAAALVAMVARFTTGAKFAAFEGEVAEIAAAEAARAAAATSLVNIDINLVGLTDEADRQALARSLVEAQAAIASAEALAARVRKQIRS